MAQINRNIELVRYRRYGDEFMVFELVNASTGTPIEPSNVGISPAPKPKTSDKTVSEYLDQSSDELRDLYLAFEDFALALGDDVTRKALKLYFAFRRIKNFACVEVHPQSKQLLVYVKVNPDDVELIDGFTRDVGKIGHFGTGDLEIALRSLDDLERAKPLIVASYEAS